MKSSSRWLIIAAILIVVLVLAAVSLALLTKDNQVTLLPDDTPQGTVQRYLVALQEKQYQTAYNHLMFSPSEKIQTYNDWLGMVSGGPQSNQAAWKAQLITTTQNGYDATVEVLIDTLSSSGPFGSSKRSQQIIFQLRHLGDKWLIISPTYVYWIY